MPSYDGKVLIDWLCLAFVGIAKLALWKAQPQTQCHIPKKQQVNEYI